MTYKPEHITDLESGAIVTAQVRPGDASDNDESLPARIEKAVTTLGQVVPEVPVEKLGAQLHACGVRTVIADPTPDEETRRTQARNTVRHRAAPGRRQKAKAARRCSANGANISKEVSAMCSTTADSEGRPCADVRS